MRLERLLLLPLLLGCTKPDQPGSVRKADVPDDQPRMLNDELPFHYPGALYARRTQGNVTLRLFIDANGLTVPDSTRVEEPSGYAEFDSAAVTGSRDLRFVPAKLRGEAMGMTILFPVYFRHPEAPPL